MSFPSPGKSYQHVNETVGLNLTQHAQTSLMFAVLNVRSDKDELHVLTGSSTSAC